MMESMENIRQWRRTDGWVIGEQTPEGRKEQTAGRHKPSHAFEIQLIDGGVTDLAGRGHRWGNWGG